jgi:pimeloyl-ACP methyl ester carboxylesterase
MNDTIKRTQTENLEIAYEEHGGPQATPVIMAHGFPTTCERDAVAPALAETDFRPLAQSNRLIGVRAA